MVAHQERHQVLRSLRITSRNALLRLQMRGKDLLNQVWW